VSDVVISDDVLGSGIGRWLGVECPRPVDPGTGRWLSRDDTWLAAVVVVCSFAVVAGCLTVTLTVRGLRGDTGPVVAEVWACAAAILVVGPAQAPPALDQPAWVQHRLLGPARPGPGQDGSARCGCSRGLCGAPVLGLPSAHSALLVGIAMSIAASAEVLSRLILREC